MSLTSLLRSSPTRTAALLLAAGASLVPLTSQAHVGFDTPEATVGGRYKAVLRVPHGCNGTPTTSVQISIPEGVIDVRPQPKPGWQLSVTEGPYAGPHKLRNDTLTEGVKTVTWSGGQLPDRQYDEFVFVAMISGNQTAGETLYFPVQQQCEQGEAHWVQLPAAQGQATPGSNEHAHDNHAAGVETGPAPRVKLQARR